MDTHGCEIEVLSYLRSETAILTWTPPKSEALTSILTAASPLNSCCGALHVLYRFVSSLLKFSGLFLSGVIVGPE